MNWLLSNYGNIVVIIILAILIVFSIISIRKRKGKCAYCSLSDNCPFANKNNLRSDNKNE